MKSACLLLALCATLVACQESLYNVTTAEMECVRSLAESDQNFNASCPAGTLDLELNVSLQNFTQQNFIQEK